ncbi:MAG: hypothetical protein SVT56_12970, partial [Chloroflexota bacterium]|nr:hypothetical protein [Chloroflexota bacterium]
YRNADKKQAQQYTFIHPGFSGFRSLTQPSFALAAAVKDQIIQSLAYQNYTIEIVDQPLNQ